MANIDIFIPIVSAIVGGGIGCFTALFVAKSKSKSERSKELMTLSVQAGIEAFKADRVLHGNSNLIINKK